VTATVLRLSRKPSSGADATRTTGDRLEVLAALMAAPTFDPLYRDNVIEVAGDHPVYGWVCKLPDCKRAQNPGYEWCQAHYKEWCGRRKAGASVADFLRLAEPLDPASVLDARSCLICPDVPATSKIGLCYYHYLAWSRRRREGDDFDAWLPRQRPYPGYGTCLVLPCPEPASMPVGLCIRHGFRYRRAGSPGGARTPRGWRQYGGSGQPPVHYADEELFHRWCRETGLANRLDGKLSLLGLRPLVKAEIQWLLFTHEQCSSGAVWCLAWVQYVIDYCRAQQVNSMVDVLPDAVPLQSQKIVREMLGHLRLVYFTREDSKEAGFIETDHFGVRFPGRKSHVDLSDVSQRWLRDLLWDAISQRLTQDPPRSRLALDEVARGCMALSAYLEASAPRAGHDPSVLTSEHMTGFVADQRHRAEHGLRSLVPASTGHGPRTRPAILTKGTMARHFNGARRVLRGALESGAADKIGLDRAFIITLPYGKVPVGRRRPFSDDVGRELARESNLRILEGFDPNDRGARDVWEILVVTGRRCREVLNLRWECIDRHNGLPMFWHDQTKVGLFEDGIRIPERLYELIERRQARTLDLFLQRYSRPATAAERKQIALFPRRHNNRSLLLGVCYAWFYTRFREWMNAIDIAHCVPHQTRHTLATNLLRNGADLTHVKRYLGHVSESMAEHYVHLANTDPRLEDALQAVWVSGPGAAEPGLLLSSGKPMTRAEAEALAIDLSRASTPAEGGFCTFQPVVNGGACPWNLNCHNCDKFVMSGADLVYWHRKREQWRMIAERAPDSGTADFLHEVFEPTARAIAGLEQALEAVGLIDEALALDLRRPQDYFGRVWNTAFQAGELAQREEDGEAV